MNNTIPKALYESTFTLFGVPIRCVVLDNGQRVVNAEDVDALFVAMETSDVDRESIQMEIDAFGRWMRGQS